SVFFFSSRRRHTRWPRDWSSDVCSSDLGMSLALTGGGAPAGKMLQAAVELWRDDINAKGGLLGRPIEIIVYDDQSNPASVPGLRSEERRGGKGRRSARRDDHVNKKHTSV